MNRLVVLFTFSLLTACTTNSTGNDSGDVTADAADSTADAARVPCSAPHDWRQPGHVCGSCNTDIINEPSCIDGALVCTRGEPLTYCPCGLEGLRTPCCARCGGPVGAHVCVAMTGRWECPAGSVECSPVDAGSCADVTPGD